MGGFYLFLRKLCFFMSKKHNFFILIMLVSDMVLISICKIQMNQNLALIWNRDFHFIILSQSLDRWVYSMFWIISLLKISSMLIPLF